LSTTRAKKRPGDRTKKVLIVRHRVRIVSQTRAVCVWLDGMVCECLENVLWDWLRNILTRLDTKVAWARNTKFESENEEVKYDEKVDRSGEFDRRPRKYGIAVITTGPRLSILQDRFRE
jgi:hypothetical protein